MAAAPKLQRIVFVDAFAWVFGSLLGCSQLTCFIESAVGIACGGRTGLSSVVTGALFLLSTAQGGKLAKLIPPELSGALLVYTAASLSPLLRHVDHGNREEAIPAILAALLIPLLNSMHAGASIGLIFYGVLLVASGKFAWRDHHTLVPLFAAAVLLVAEILTSDFK